jgi:hypothetical protein
VDPVTRLKWFGPNVGYDPVFDPVRIGQAGFNSLAIVVTKEIPLHAYVDRCSAAGITICGTIAGGSLDGFANASEAAEFYFKNYPEIAVWTILNEADGVRDVHQDGSWILDDDVASGILQAFRAAFPIKTPLYGVGTVTGDPAYFNDPDGPGVLDLSGYDGVDNHAYAQWPQTVWNMLRNYDFIDARFEMTSRVIREFGWPHPDPAMRGQYVRDMVRAIEQGNDRRLAEGLSTVDGMWVYCWDAIQHTSPFFVNDPNCLRYIQELGYGPDVVPEPGPTPPEPLPPEPEPTPGPRPWVTWTNHNFPGYSMGPGMHEALLKHGYTPVADEQAMAQGVYHVLLAQKGTERRWLIWNGMTKDITVLDGRIA